MVNKKYKTWDDLIEDKTHREGSCLIWDAGTHSQSYPMVRWDIKMVQVIRKQMEEKIGRPLKGRAERVKNVRCGNVLCVNPDHYEISEYGSDEWKCIAHAYTKEQVADIKKIYKEYQHPVTGTKYGAFELIKKSYPNISNTTLLKYIDKK